MIIGPKLSVTSFKNYIVIVSPPFFPSGSNPSATVRNYVARTPNAGSVDVSKITILDMQNHLTAYSEATFTEGVRDVFTHFGSVYVLGNDAKVCMYFTQRKVLYPCPLLTNYDAFQLFRIEEKSTTQKLDLLYGRALYPVAIGLAKSEGLDAEHVAAIHKQYADHLYAKGEFEQATVNYVKTLGFVQPSYVIRRVSFLPRELISRPHISPIALCPVDQFLDAQQIHNLATYLQELHARGLANSDHTTLLLNTYTKLRDVTRLDAFIKSTSTSTTSSRLSSTKAREASADQLPFDLETAIRVCRQAGYFEHAVYLAKKYERHDDYLRIQIEDVGNVKDALGYLRSLGPEVVRMRFLKRNGT